MIEAKNKFREGYIMLTRPFQFVELKNPIQKLTILWAYSEQPIIKQVLTKEAEEKIDAIENQSTFLRIPFGQDKDEWIMYQIERVTEIPSSYEPLYEGEIVQAYIEGQLCRFYPDEYNIMNKERLFEIMREDGYHTIIAPELQEIKEFPSKNQLHKAAKILTRDMMLRNESYSQLVKEEFKDAIRLSMHPSVNNGAKYSFQLIPSPKAWTAPWHCALLINALGEYETIHRKDAIAQGHELVYKNNQPYYFQSIN